MSRVWPVNTLFQKVGKSGFVQTQLEAFQEHPSSLAINLNISFVFPLYLKYLGINKEHLKPSIVKRKWLRDGHFVKDKHAKI